MRGTNKRAAANERASIMQALHRYFNLRSLVHKNGRRATSILYDVSSSFPQALNVNMSEDTMSNRTDACVYAHAWFLCS